MNTYPYDPELPYILVQTRADNITTTVGKIRARFDDLDDANDLADTYADGFVKVIDTTPKPKIPEDAKYITWQSGSSTEVAVFENYNALKPWVYNGFYFSIPELEEEIGDADVTVLVPKEES